MHYSVRQSKDIETLIQLNNKIFIGEPIERKNNMVWWGCFSCDSKPVGFCTVTDIGERIIFLSRCGILSEHSGNGLHKRMIKVRMAYAKKHGFNMAITYVAKDNPQSFVNLIKDGWEIYTPELDYAGKEFFYFRKSLQ